jgi:hypothetical protein
MREMSQHLKEALKESEEVEVVKKEEVVKTEKKLVKKVVKTEKKIVKKKKKEEVVEETKTSFFKTFTERSWAHDRAKRKNRADVGKQRWTVGVDPTLEVRGVRARSARLSPLVTPEYDHEA